MKQQDLLKSLLRLRAREGIEVQEPIPKPRRELSAKTEINKQESVGEIEKPKDVDVRLSLAAIPAVAAAVAKIFVGNFKPEIEQANTAFKATDRIIYKDLPTEKPAKTPTTITEVFNNLGIRWRSAMEYARERLGRKKDGTVKSPYQSGGQCLNAVANIAKAGGMNLKSAAKASDKINGTLLYTSMQQDGWVELGIGDPDAYPNKLPGDVVVEEATKTNTAGHIQIWDGKSWISDFVQNSTHVHSKGEGKKHYYRYGPLVASLGDLTPRVDPDMYLVKRSDTKSGRAVTWNDKFDQFAQAEGLGGADSQCTYISGTNTEFIQDNTLELVNAPLKATIL